MPSSIRNRTARDRCDRDHRGSRADLLPSGEAHSAAHPCPVTLPNTPVSMDALKAAQAIADTARIPLPDAWPLSAERNTAVAPHAMVASNSALASDAGLAILREGGNAVDAAVATGFALAVTHPEAGNLGGGGYMLIRLNDGRSFALDYREVAPLAATRDMYLDAKGHVTRQERGRAPRVRACRARWRG